MKKADIKNIKKKEKNREEKKKKKEKKMTVLFLEFIIPYVFLSSESVFN